MPGRRTYARRLERDGFAVWELRNRHLSLQVVPEIGAKIVSLVHQPTGREWMWHPPDGLRLFRNRPGDPFGDSTKAGADECLPTLVACTWRGLDLPDHGEAWSLSWDLDEAAASRGVITTRVQLPVSPLAIERSITIEANTVRLRYRLRNTGSGPFEYVWSLHPLLTVHEDDRIVLPPEVTSVRVDNASAHELRPRGTRIAWPAPAPGYRLDHREFRDPGAGIKVYTDPLREGWAAIESRHEGIRFEFDTRQLDTLGVWINRGACGGYTHVGLEPACCAPDPLDEAVRVWKRFRALECGAEARWDLVLRLLGPASPLTP